MKRKNWLLVALTALFSVLLLAGCNTETEEADAPADNDENNASEETGSYEDGIYFAQEDNFSEESGWKYMVTLEVEDGAIVSADWNGAHKSGGDDKDTVSANGEYGMVEKAGAQAPWHEQAEKAEAYLIENQDPTAIEYTDDEGHTDAISGVSIHVIEFFDLAETALEKGPVEKGPYTDGAYHAEEDQFSEKSGWKYTVDLTVVNGNIVAADWNGVHKDGGDDKDTVSANGEYGMVENGGAIAPWHEQAEKAEAYLLETQDPTAIEYTNDEGATDVISGVTIKVGSFFTLAEKALAEAE
ncbi:FMN-binding domain protein [Paraliobacillus sp. PM-2]|uniref:FMN-binding protein n=1 Tax=Paraliobacillus sp. PM-2 TaxID=1462524 RepID=UPI00061CC854|nr:FMN-binding protein [Paraliobacillus sp. PM-2]CQR47040.1 FMN-binding domain protein [Paraliobacillus sp. PM-2]